MLGQNRCESMFLALFEVSVLLVTVQCVCSLQRPMDMQLGAPDILDYLPQGRGSEMLQAVGAICDHAALAVNQDRRAVAACSASAINEIYSDCSNQSAINSFATGTTASKAATSELKVWNWPQSAHWHDIVKFGASTCHVVYAVR